MKFRLASPTDAAAILEIYRPYIEKTAITFEYEVPTVGEFAARIVKTLEHYPYLVAEENGKILGYAYASRFRARIAYDWDAELSIYLAENARQQGIGKHLYQKLFALLEKQNLRKLYANITWPNPESIHFHKNIGFTEVGLFKDCGYKFDQWYDTLFLELDINQDKIVQPVRWLSSLTSNEISEILK
ncbi:MAG: GNAT family N-acetyltransferase [Streptococcaceae bacterium]|jgi:phosphinothricin acetyltransferase|nr:GNAT family N-acetyltransferase [Streptococcaceae bacterium]